MVIFFGPAIPGPKTLFGFHNVYGFFHLFKDHMFPIQPFSFGGSTENWEPFAMDKISGTVCFSIKYSSSNFSS